MPFQFSSETAVISVLVGLVIVLSALLYFRALSIGALQEKFRLELAEQFDKGIALGRDMAPSEKVLKREYQSGWAGALASLSYYHSTFDRTRHGWFTTEKAGATLNLVVTDDGTKKRILFANFSFKQSTKEDVEKVLSTFAKISGIAASAAGHPLAGAALIAAAGSGDHEASGD